MCNGVHTYIKGHAYVYKVIHMPPKLCTCAKVHAHMPEKVYTCVHVKSVCKHACKACTLVHVQKHAYANVRICAKLSAHVSMSEQRDHAKVFPGRKQDEGR